MLRELIKAMNLLPKTFYLFIFAQCIVVYLGKKSKQEEVSDHDFLLLSESLSVRNFPFIMYSGIRLFRALLISNPPIISNKCLSPQVYICFRKHSVISNSRCFEQLYWSLGSLKLNWIRLYLKG